MPIEFPACIWPKVLEERGPASDPTILLTGTIEIAGSIIQLVAIRVSHLARSTPDYRDDLADGDYAAGGLTEVLDATLEEMEFIASEFSELLGESGSGEVLLGDAYYRLWLVSGSMPVDAPIIQ
jgi:hypothetical protein